MCSSSYKHGYANGKQNIHDYNFNMLSASKRKYKLFNVHIYVFAAGGLLSALLFSREGFCPPCHFHGRAFVRPLIFTGGPLSALSFSWEGFCPPCHFLTGGLLSYTPYFAMNYEGIKFKAYIILVFKVSKILYSLV
jgi:hypothetical protein